MDRTIQLACTSDGSYAPHTGTMLQSVLSRETGPFHVHVLYRDLATADMAGLRAVVEQFGGKADFIAIAPAQLAGFVTDKFHPSCWFRVLLPELLPRLDKVLYLDSDIVATESVRPLWETDLGDAGFAAATNPLYPLMRDFRRGLGLTDARRYINSGVLLMNLERMRREQWVARLRAYSGQHPANLYPEQDALSALFGAQCRLLHPRWNAQTSLWDLDLAQLPLEPEAAAEARARPALVHYIGPYKPWQYICRHPLRSLYFEHRAQTPWPVAPIEGKTLRTVVLRRLPVVWHVVIARIEAPIRAALRGLARRWRARFGPRRSAPVPGQP